MTYLASFTNNEQIMGVESNFEIMNYPVMDNSIVLNKQSRVLTCKLPSIEFSFHLRRNNGIDFGFTLLKLDDLVNIPIQVFAKMFEKKQFVFNLTTYYLFSVELAGTALTKDEYQVVLKHEFLNNMFEDFKLTLSSLEQLSKLRLRWESESGKELLKNLNATTQKLLEGSLASLATISESARKMANDTMVYMRNDGRDKLMAAVNQSKERIMLLKELLLSAELNATIEKYSVRASELLIKMKRDLLKIVDEMKIFGEPLIDTYNYMKKTTEEITMELLVHYPAFTLKLQEWVERTVNRYLAVSVCGITIEEIVNMVQETKQLYYKMVKDTIQMQIELYKMKYREMKSVLKEMESLAKKVMTTVEDFTCNYDLECTKRNVQIELKKLAGLFYHDEIKRLFERLNKIVERLTQKYKEMEAYVLLKVEEHHLRERVMKVLQPIVDYLISLREDCPIAFYYNKMKMQQEELLKTVEEAMMNTSRNVEVAKEALFNRVDEAKTSLKVIRTTTLVMYEKLVKLLRKLNDMTVEEMQAYAKNEIEVNYEKLIEKLDDVRRTVTEKVEGCLERHAVEIERIRKLGRTILETYKDIIDGRITSQDVQEKFEVLLRKIVIYLKEQKMRAMDKIKSLKLEETVTKTYKSAVEVYRKASEDLREKMTVLYPKVIEELENLLLKIKKTTVMYVELAKTKMLELREKEIISLKKAMDKLLETKEILIKNVNELLEQYKDYGLNVVENMQLDMMKQKEKYQQKVKEAITEYKDKLTTTAEEVKEEIVNTLKLYQDMPIEDIYADLKLKASEAFDKLLGFSIGELLITYEEVLEKYDEIKEIYQRNRMMVDAKWKKFMDVVEELNQKYGALVEKNYEKVSMYYRGVILPVTTAYIQALDDLNRDVMAASGVKFEQLKLWYEHVKYMKFKEFYYSLRDQVAKWDFTLMECCEKKFKAVVEEIKKMKTTVEDFIQDVKEESKNVIRRIEEVNADVKLDTVKTFEPFVKAVRDILLEHKDKTVKKFAPMMASLEEYKNTTERYVNRRIQDIKDLDQDEIMDMVVAKLERCPFLMQVKESYGYVKEGNLTARVIESLNRCPFLMQVKENYEYILEGKLRAHIIEYLIRCPFLTRVRTHPLWPALKHEFVNHEIVLGSKELGESSANKLKELSTDYYSRSLSSLRDLKENAYEGLEQLKKDMSIQNEHIKKTITEKREELNGQLRDTHAKLRSNGERLVEEARDVYQSGDKLIQETIEHIGEMSIYDIESKIYHCVKNLLAPFKTAYTDLSKFVIAELVILDNQHRELQGRVNTLRQYLMNLSNYIGNRYEDMSTKANEWGMRAWTISKPELEKLENLSVKILGHLEKCTNKCMAVGQRFIDEYIPYEDFLKITPKELIERLREVPVKAEKLFKSVKAITEVYIESLMRMFNEMRKNVDYEKIQEMKEKAEKFVNNTRDQLEFLVTESLETAVFVAKFYGSPDTVYSAHPEMAQMADFQLQRFLNCSRICKAKATKFFNEARDVVEQLFAKANDSYHNQLPQLVKYVKTEIEKYDTEKFDTEMLKKVQKMATVFMDESKEYIEIKFGETLVALELSSLKLQEYLMSKRSEMTLKLNEAKENLEMLLKTEVQKAEKVYNELLAMVEDAKARALDVYVNIKADIPILMKNAIGELPLILDTMKQDLEKLMDIVVGKIDEGKQHVVDEILPMLRQGYADNVNTLRKNLFLVKETTNDMMKSVRKDIMEELPLVKKQLLNIIEIIRKTEIALVSGEMEMKLPRFDEIREILSELKAMLTKKYQVVYVKLEGHFQESKKNGEEMVERLIEDTKTTWDNLRMDVAKFTELTSTKLRELAEPKLESLKQSLEMAIEEFKRMRNEARDFCEEKKMMFQNKCKTTKQMVEDNVKIMLEKSEEIFEDLKKQVSELKSETKLKIEKLQSEANTMNNNLMEAVREHRNMLEEFTPMDIKEFLNQYIDVDDLINKTIELEEDFVNLTLVHDLVAMGKTCFTEGRRLMDLAKESSEFALYVMKRVVKYSDVWAIVEELTNPFHWIPPTNSIAMIFGKPHVYTFDGQSYQFTGYKKPSCTYVLAHDFRDNNFTIMSQETALIINTKSGFIKIHASGKVEATVSKDAEGNDVKTTHYELPVEMQQMTVRREGSFIKIKHDTGLDVVCDLRHFMCTFNINKFYHGKLAGLLGTNNNEQYDEFLKPDKTIAKSVVEFANAWEVSGDPECKVNPSNVLKPTCEKKPSPRCAELFESESSPLATYFKTVDPQPFYEACIFDTSDCKTDVSPNESFCNVTAAYTALLRQKGVWARQLHECVSCGSKGLWQKWTERGSKSVDVVLLIPETLNLQTHAENLPSLLRGLESDLIKYKPRYAVVGFGGKSAVHSRPHIVTGGGKIFGGIKDVESAISNMKFTSDAANAFEAIEHLANLPFLPGASKVVILVTDQDREARVNAPLEKAIKDLNMQGVIFNVIAPYFQKKQHRDVLGLWRGQAMLRKNKFQSKLANIGLPSNDYTRLAESSQGGIFNLKAFSKEHGDWTSLLKRTMKTTIVKQIDEDQTYCRQCACVSSLTAEPVTICRVNKHSRCS